MITDYFPHITYLNLKNSINDNESKQSLVIEVKFIQ